MDAYAKKARRNINRRVRPPLTDQEWDYLVATEYAADVLVDPEDEDDLSALVKAIVELRDAFGSSAQSSTKAGDAAPETRTQRRHLGARPRVGLHRQTSRDEALTDVYATLAGRDEGVLSFRERALRGRLLQLEEVGAWLEERANEELPPDYWLNDVRVDLRHFSLLKAAEEGRWELFPHDEHGTLQPVPLTIWFNPGILGDEARRHEVSCEMRDPATGQWSVMQVPVADGGVLDELRWRAKHLSGRYGWTETGAATFLLTGIAPQVSSAPSYKFEFLPYVTWIELKLDPNLSPEQVAGIYHECRDQIIRVRAQKHADKSSRPRVRGPDDRTLRLVQFVLHRPENESWEERRRAWNREYPNWAYKQVNADSFRRQAEDASESLLHPPHFARMPFDEHTFAGKLLAQEEEWRQQEEEQERAPIDTREDTGDHP